MNTIPSKGGHLPDLRYRKTRTPCSHLLLLEVGYDLAFTDRVINTLRRELVKYGEWGYDYIVTINNGHIFMYFKDRAAAVHYAISW